MQKHLTKIIFITICITIALLSTTALALEVDTGVKEELEDLYQYESLTIDVEVTGEFDLSKEKSSAKASEVSAKLALVPFENIYQTIITQKTSANPKATDIKPATQEIEFIWDNPSFESHSYTIESTVKTSQNKHLLKTNPSFPITLSQKEVEEYNLNKFLAVTETIDWDNSQIQAKAIELTQGKDNLFEVTFTLASWVEENVNYDLTTLNKDTSQKASTVLRTKSGVCDEMTSLFIAMARSLGIPAKFVSGLTYTNSDLFDEPWQAHGWAEIYFPGHGWVSFDPTFGEYGYVDATHIPMKESNDPTHYTTLYKWIGSGIDFEDTGLDLSATVTNKGTKVKDKYDTNTQILSETVQFGSYNLISAYLEDNTGTFQAATLELFTPKEVEIISRYKQSAMIENKGQTAIYWIVKVSEDLQEDFMYTFPYVIRTDTKKLIESSFQGTQSNQFYTKDEIEEIIPTTKTLLALEAIEVVCDYEKIVHTNTKEEISCDIQNIQNANIKNLNICHENTCETIDINPTQSHTFTTTFSEEFAGWKTQIITLKNEDISYTATLPMQALDVPKVAVQIQAPNQIEYNDEFKITIDLRQESFAAAQNLNIDLQLGAASYNWNIDEFSGEETIILEATSQGLAKENSLNLQYSWEDATQNTFEEQTQATIFVNPTTFKEKTMLLINKINIWLATI